MSKRAVLFAVLSYIVIFLGAGLPFPQANQPGPRWLPAHLNLLHVIGAFSLVLASAWVQIRARAMEGYARTSASLIVLLTILSFALGIATALSDAPLWSAPHQLAAAALLFAAVWHVYEMRIYPVGVRSL